MPFKSKFGNKAKKSNFTRIGNLFKSDKEHTPIKAEYTYSTSCGDKYLTAVLETMVKAADEGQAVRFSLTKWKDQEHPVLTVSPIKPKDQEEKRITKAKASVDTGLGNDPGQEIE